MPEGICFAGFLPYFCKQQQTTKKNEAHKHTRKKQQKLTKKNRTAKTHKETCRV
jgi:hypothetical protein